MARSDAPWGGGRVVKARARIQRQMDRGVDFWCHRCGRAIGPGVAWHIDHVRAQADDPESRWDESNWAVSCAACNLRAGQVTRALRQGTRVPSMRRTPRPRPPAVAVVEASLDSVDFDDPRCPRHLAYLPCARCLADS